MKAKLATLFTLLVIAVPGPLHLRAAEPIGRPRAETQAFMRTKLAWSQAALEGITLERFDVVAKNAIRMRDMTHSNLWFTVRQRDYMAQTTNFQNSATALYLAAIDKNLDSATEAYTQLARNCVACHRLVRAGQRRSPLASPVDKP